VVKLADSDREKAVKRAHSLQSLPYQIPPFVPSLLFWVGKIVCLHRTLTQNKKNKKKQNFHCCRYSPTYPFYPPMVSPNAVSPGFSGDMSVFSFNP
jgi:hypothetical protein